MVYGLLFTLVCVIVVGTAADTAVDRIVRKFRIRHVPSMTRIMEDVLVIYTAVNVGCVMIAAWIILMLLGRLADEKVAWPDISAIYAPYVIVMGFILFAARSWQVGKRLRSMRTSSD